MDEDRRAQAVPTALPVQAEQDPQGSREPAAPVQEPQSLAPAPGNGGDFAHRNEPAAAAPAPSAPQADAREHQPRAPETREQAQPGELVQVETRPDADADADRVKSE